ncbi:hypothetical protein VHEMI05850 [[Torrubiella] hemipterigena]|uniref:Uncharacterized protein n=1 Tax=[Torrubiella] hemipterigena TaxID=1531966 RepID=A0A0A1THN8_9HYPO|nr:hypothetical protein VHEMI05850 [[Torrubiella] hemipterigena]
MNSSFSPSPYRGPPSPEVDEAWESLSRRGLQPMRIPRDDLFRLNKTLDESIILYGEGGNQYADGMLEVFHQLHCLDSIRKTIWGIEHYPEVFASLSARNHVDHCIEILRQYIMCTADVSVVTFKRVLFKSIPEPDFSSTHVCRDFEAIMEFVENRTPA